MPDQHGSLTPNEIHRVYECKERILREYDSHVRKYGTEIALFGLRKALDEILTERHMDAVGRHFWEK